MSEIGDLSGYDWGNINWAFDKYNTTKTLTEFISAVCGIRHKTMKLM